MIAVLLIPHTITFTSCDYITVLNQLPAARSLSDPLDDAGHDTRRRAKKWGSPSGLRGHDFDSATESL